MSQFNKEKTYPMLYRERAEKEPTVMYLNWLGEWCPSQEEEMNYEDLFSSDQLK